MEVIWYTGVSMDGKLASAEHSLDFLGTIGQNEACLAAFRKFYSSVDATIVGAETLRWLVRGGHGWPHGEKPTWVVTRDTALVASIGRTEAPLRRVEGDLEPMVKEIRGSGANRVWLCGGGNIAGQLLTLDAIEAVDVTIAPVALGGGPSLFGQRALFLGSRAVDLRGRGTQIVPDVLGSPPRAHPRKTMDWEHALRHLTGSPEWMPLVRIAGGTLIGLSVTMMMLLHGRIAGISGILHGATLQPVRGDWAWRALFIAGLLVGGAIMVRLFPQGFSAVSNGNPFRLAIAGLLVGIGTRMGCGCTSGHGVCGVSRFSPRSLVATGTFMATGMAAVLVVQSLEGGS